MNGLDPFLGVIMGLGLAAACGFRVFVPLFVVSMAAASGQVELGSGFSWMGSPLALIMFGSATMLEVAGYYVPWIDNLLDTIATPAAVIAGAIVTAAAVGDMNPALRWALAIIAGGGLAGLVQVATVTTRGGSTVSTAGLANPAIATGELAASGLLAILSVLWPLIALVLLAILIALVMWLLTRRRRARARTSHPT